MFAGRGTNRMGVSRLYTRFIAVFIILAIILIFVIFYFSLSQAEIVIKPRITTVSSDFIADIETQAATPSATVIAGDLFETEITKQGDYPATGSKAVEGDVIGKVTVINNLDRNQPLVRQTRLLTADGVLLRLNSRIDVPAHGSVEAEVYADDPSSFESVPPSSFTIPGLSESLQTKVYAESKSVIASKPGSIKVVKSVDIERAKEALAAEIYNQALEQYQQQAATDKIAIVVSKKIQSQEVSAAIDDQADKFTVKQTMAITIVGLAQNDIVNLAAERLKQLVAGDMRLKNINLDNLSYVVQNFDEQAKTANIKIHAEGATVLQTDSEILSKDKLAGLSARGVELYLMSYDEIEGVEVNLEPFWVKKIPSLPDHINIRITE